MELRSLYLIRETQDKVAKTTLSVNLQILGRIFQNFVGSVAKVFVKLIHFNIRTNSVSIRDPNLFYEVPKQEKETGPHYEGLHKLQVKSN